MTRAVACGRPGCRRRHAPAVRGLGRDRIPMSDGRAVIIGGGVDGPVRSRSISRLGIVRVARPRAEVPGAPAATRPSVGIIRQLDPRARRERWVR